MYSSYMICLFSTIFGLFRYKLQSDREWLDLCIELMERVPKIKVAIQHNTHSPFTHAFSLGLILFN